MNEIISTLERAKEMAKAKLVAVKAFPICTDSLDYRAVYEMAYDHLRDTIYLFRHTRKLKQKLEADERSSLPPTRDPRQSKGQGSISGGWPAREEQDAPD